MRKFVCLYLNTGSGHRAPANVLKYAMEKAHPDASVEVLNGADSKNYFARFFLEKFHQFICNYISGLWVLVYEFGMKRWVQKIGNMIISPHTAWYLKKLIQKYQATDVVCFHFILIPSVVSAIRRLGGNIPLTVIVTDPFTVPIIWFYEKNVKYFVFSEIAKEQAVKEYGVPEENVSVVPFLLNPKFLTPLSKSDLLALKEKHGIPVDKKVVLLAGGGGGLPNAVRIVQHFIRRKVTFTILVVCGKDAAAKRMLDVMTQLYPSIDLRPMGFISYVDEMVKVCDCAVTKAGTSSLMEVLVSGKPVIISSYIHGQELGNMQFAVRNKVARYIRDPSEICDAVCRLFNDESYLNSFKRNIGSLPLSIDIKLVADKLYNRDFG
ncbi:MGDG synthase family glycosyltransferase [Treponema sp.]|uniref:MGDG synthase family glycosyltransferase n=1 Tax=Treponema sp. TaxID=166 RepID=UPI003FA292AF